MILEQQVKESAMIASIRGWHNAEKRLSNYCYALMQEPPSECLIHPACSLIFSTQSTQVQ